MKNALLDAEDINVVVVHWEKGAKLPFHEYEQAVANTRVVAVQISMLVNKMEVCKLWF